MGRLGFVPHQISSLRHLLHCCTFYRSKIVVCKDTRVVGLHRQYCFLALLSEKFYAWTLKIRTAMHQIELRLIDTVRQGCSTSPFILNSDIQGVPKYDSPGTLDGKLEFLRLNRFADLQCTSYPTHFELLDDMNYPIQSLFCTSRLPEANDRNTFCAD